MNQTKICWLEKIVVSKYKGKLETFTEKQKKGRKLLIGD